MGAEGAKHTQPKAAPWVLAYFMNPCKDTTYNQIRYAETDYVAPIQGLETGF